MTSNFPAPIQIETENASFWNELCGSSLAGEIGIKDHSMESLRDFDQAYFKFYPYLKNYLGNSGDFKDKKILEIGLGYGSVGHYLASQRYHYSGLDIAPEPARMMKFRLENSGRKDLLNGIHVGSALHLPFPNDSFNIVYAIGSLHHTGDTPRALSEIYRVLAPGGKTVIMLYNRRSFRRVVFAPLYYCVKWFLGQGTSKRFPGYGEYIRLMYDKNTAGSAAPHTDFVSTSEIRSLFKEFNVLRIDKQNFDELSFWKGRIKIPRKVFLNNLAKLWGLDLYITAQKGV